MTPVKLELYERRGNDHVLCTELTQRKKLIHGELLLDLADPTTRFLVQRALFGLGKQPSELLGEIGLDFMNDLVFIHSHPNLTEGASHYSIRFLSPGNKLEKVMLRRHKRRWLWVLLFIWMATLLVGLAAGWNVVLISHYHEMLALARQASSSVSVPWMGLVLGTVGFGTLLATLLLFFLKILREMRLNQLQSEFLETVSHELKTPIASIELSSSLLRTAGLTSSEVERLWTSHQAELKRLREDVDTLLEAARIQSHPIRVKQSPIELEAWLKQSLDRWKNLLGPGATLRREGDALQGCANLELKALNLIADNLVDNARKFSKGTPELVVYTARVPARGLWHRARWHIEFRDQGWGFNPSDSRRIFSRFFRARTDSPNSIPGSGLGLHLADSASRALGIRLKGESHGPGTGARFTLEGRELK
jgi:signal transduction histidine kinase